MVRSALHTLEWSSQSLCWQNGPQYLAKLHPEQVSVAGLPQFQQDWNIGYELQGGIEIMGLPLLCNHFDFPFLALSLSF